MKLLRAVTGIHLAGSGRSWFSNVLIRTRSTAPDGRACAR